MWDMDMQPQPFTVCVDAWGLGQVRVEVGGELDLITAPHLTDALNRELDLGRDVLLDLSAVSFIDSAGLHAIILAARRATARGQNLALHPVLPRQTRRLFEITNLHRLLPVAA